MIIPSVEKRTGLWTLLTLIVTIFGVIISLIVLNYGNSDFETDPSTTQIESNKPKGLPTDDENLRMTGDIIQKLKEKPEITLEQSNQLKANSNSGCNGNIDISIDCPL